MFLNVLNVTLFTIQSFRILLSPGTHLLAFGFWLSAFSLSFQVLPKTKKPLSSQDSVTPGMSNLDFNRLDTPLGLSPLAYPLAVGGPLADAAPTVILFLLLLLSSWSCRLSLSSPLLSVLLLSWLLRLPLALFSTV